MTVKILKCLAGVLACLALAWPVVAGWPGASAWIVDGVAQGGVGVVVSEVDGATSNRFPTLVLELDDQWTDFELQASVDNFASHTGWVYYARSWAPTVCPDDTNVWIYFTDDYSSDPRKWHKAVYGTSIAAQLSNPTNSRVRSVAVYPSHECNNNWEAWMFPTNRALVWSYLKYDGIGPETNAVGSNVWNVVVPICWNAERTAPE